RAAPRGPCRVQRPTRQRPGRAARQGPPLLALGHVRPLAPHPRQPTPDRPDPRDGAPRTLATRCRPARTDHGGTGMTHATALIHDEHGTTAMCLECHQRLDDSVTETEAHESARLHRVTWAN